MKRWLLAGLLAISVWILPTVALADTSADVTVTAVPDWVGLSLLMVVLGFFALMIWDEVF